MREKLIELIERFCCGLTINDVTPPYGYENLADHLIANGVTIQQWIPVTERLPDSQSDVLVVAFWHERWQTMIGWHSDYGQKWRVITPHGEREPGGVTHWMPLPEPPSGERRTDDNN